MWISFVVPVAVLLGTLLLQRLEAALLTTPEPTERPTEHPVHGAAAARSDPAAAPRPRAPRASTAGATV